MADAVTLPCTVFLAPPGAGKTTDLQRTVTALGSEARLIALGNDFWLRSEVDDAIAFVEAARAAGKGDPLLALDGLDESSLTTTALAALIEGILARLGGSARLAVACRTAAWFPGVDLVLRQTFGDIVIFDLEPLTDGDIASYASSRGLDPGGFLSGLQSAHARPLAATPMMLGFLAAEYAAGASIPGSQLDLYERSCTRLVTEPNPRRRDRLSSAQAPSLLDEAGRLAVFSLFTGRPVFGLSDDPRPDALTSRDTDRADVLATALFDGAGIDHVRFTHQAVAEYLAARYLIGAELSASQLDGLLRGRGGLLAPQVQAVAAWLIAQHPARFATLLDDDPLAFLQSSVEMTDPVYRRNLVERLVQLAQRYELADFHGLPLHGLAYDGIEDLLRFTLTDPTSSIDARYLAIRLAKANDLTGLGDTLVGVALDPDQPVPIRNSAGHLHLDFPPTGGVSPLTVLADLAGESPDDGDELLGVGLCALLAGGESPAELLRRLKQPSDPDLFGSYRSFVVMELPGAFRSPNVAADDLSEALAWLTDLETAAVTDASSAALLKLCTELSDAILTAGILGADNDSVRDATVQLIHTRVDAHHQLFRDRSFQPPQVPQSVRRQLLLSLAAVLNHRFHIWSVARSGLVTAADFAWILDEAEESGLTDPWSAWATMLFDRSRPDHQTALKAVPPTSALFESVVLPLLRPLATLDEVQSEAQEADAPASLTNDQLRATMIESLAREPHHAFHIFCHWAQFTGGEPYSHDQWTLDVTRLAGWAILDHDQRLRAYACAESYLATAESSGARLLGTNEYEPRAFSGTRALVLLASRGRITKLPPDRWGFWTAALIHTPPGSAEDGLLLTALQQAYAHARDALVAAAEAEMRGKPSTSQFVLRRLAPVLTVQAAAWLVEVINDEYLDDAARSVAFERLLALDEDQAVELLRASLATDRVAPLAVTAIKAVGDQGWTAARQALLSSTDLAERVIGDLAERHEFAGESLSEPYVAELWDLAQRLFPSAEDPVMHGVHTVGRRESIGHLRNGLLPALAQRGTAAAVRVLGELADSRPGTPGIRRLWALARAAFGRSDWTPLTPSEVRVILSSSKRVMRNDHDLLEVVMEALNRIQEKVQGATPMATLLWNHTPQCKQPNGVSCRPKTEDEISDYLAGLLTDLIQGVVVNREVQITRKRTSGIGQRTDISVEVPAPAGSERILRLVVEVKGCWNDEISDALENQLVERYVKKWTNAAGIFLVAWFGQSHSSAPSTWHAKRLDCNFSELITNLGARAGHAADTSGHAIQSFVLDCSMPS